MKQYKILFTSRYAIDSYTQPIVDNVRTHCEVICGVDFFWESDVFYDVIHFQWPEELFGWKVVSQEDLVRLEERIQYWLVKGTRLIITRHNELPHRKAETDAALYGLFEKYSHGQIHMGLFSLNKLSFKNAKNVFIEHPNNIHLNINLDRELIRKKYHILPNEIVYLLFGKLRDKEDEDGIVRNFSKIRKSDEVLYVSHSNYVKRNKAGFFDSLVNRVKNILLRKKGIDDLYIACMESYGELVDPKIMGIDATISFPPHLKPGSKNIRIKPSFWDDLKYKLGGKMPIEYKHYIADYKSFAEAFLSQQSTTFKNYPAVSPMWDNSARKESRGLILKDSSPEVYEWWLRETLNNFKPYSDNENFIFINAWNEWAEGNHLEPCRKWGLSYLEATKRIFDCIENSLLVINCLQVKALFHKILKDN